VRIVVGQLFCDNVSGRRTVSFVNPTCIHREEQAVATVRYLVRDVDAALPFYEALGFTLGDRWGPPFAIVERGDLALWLSGPGTSAAKPMPDGAKPESGGWNRIVIELDDIDATVAALKATGTRFRNEPISGPGGKQVLVEDPSGNPIELFEAKKA
jgi:catechol 2,3-dioxygenase-like lactoylglutathione lyase family enzyme